MFLYPEGMKPIQTESCRMWCEYELIELSIRNDMINKTFTRLLISVRLTTAETSIIRGAMPTLNRWEVGHSSAYCLFLHTSLARVYPKIFD